MFRSIGDLAVSVMLSMGDGVHGGAGGKPLDAVLAPGQGGVTPAIGIALEKDGAVTPRQVYREVVNTDGQPQARETYGKHMLTVLHGAQDQARSAATKRAPASATCLVLVTVDGMRVDHAAALTGSSR